MTRTVEANKPLADAPRPGPNVLLIMTDQHTYFAQEGVTMPDGSTNDTVETPNLNRLRREGAFFTHAFCNVPYCSPARATVFTGVHAHKHGVCSNVNEGAPGLDGTPYAVTENILHGKGYIAGHWGKFHTHNTLTREPSPFQTAWHCNTNLSCYESWPAGIEYRREERLEGLNEESRKLGYRDWAHLLHSPVSHHPVIENNDYSWDMISQIGKSDVPEHLIYEKPHVDEVVETIRALGDKPWMITLSLHPPHGPWKAPDPYYSMYQEKEITLPDNQEAHPTDQVGGWAGPVAGGELGPEGIKEFIRVYYAQTTLMDKFIGQVLDTLDEMDLADNTLVVFTSDHGDMLGSHHCVSKNIGAFFEYCMRVPLIIRYPAEIPAGTEVDALADLTDILPTILDYSGQADSIPDNIDGQSLRAVIDSPVPPDSWRSAIYGQRTLPLEGNWKNTDHVQRMIRTRKYKYWWSQEGGYDSRLYDMANDPWEKNNLFHDPDYMQVATDMHTQLRDWMQVEGDYAFAAMPPEPVQHDETGVEGTC